MNGGILNGAARAAFLARKKAAKMEIMTIFLFAGPRFTFSVPIGYQNNMPTLNWIGKKAAVNHDKEVPFRLLKKLK